MGTAYNFLGQAEAGMGVVAADFNNDLRLDLFVTHLALETNTLYLRDDLRIHRLPRARAVWPRRACGRPASAPDALDLDQDGLLDLIVVNGRVTRGDPAPRGRPYRRPGICSRNPTSST